MKTKQILLCGIPSEGPIAKVNKALLNYGAQVVIFNQRQIEDIGVNWEFKEQQPTGELHIANCSYALEDFDAIYSRFMGESNIPEVKAGDERLKEHCREVHEALYQWMEVTDSKVVNRNSKMFSNSSKPYQAQIIRKYGLKTPDTLITNSPDEVIAFYEKHGPLIYKSISGVRSIVKEFDPKETERLQKIRYCPVQFQKKLSGFDVRVHVIGKEVVATKILTSGVDYRYARREGGTTELEPFSINDTIKNACVNVSAALELDFSGIDLRITDDNDVYCFEVNPMPGYSYYESHTGQQISAVLAKYLMA
jgi:glutathione synthase/RimK-type ligase-like ATP-grasp enzyme